VPTGEVRQARAFAARQRHVAAVRPALEAVHRIGQARAAFGQVGRVDLRQVAQADDLGARAGAGDQRLHLLGREVLRLVDEHELVQEGAPAHEVQALDLDLAAHQVVGGGAAPFAGAAVAARQHLQVVVQRAHPRAHLLFFGAGQEADVLAHRHRHAGDDDLGVAAVVEHLARPAASVISVLPVPAVPVSVMKSHSGSISRFSAKAPAAR
jgi:hypothetical protein